MNNSTQHMSKRVSGCSLLRKRRCLVWPVLAALVLSWTGWDLPLAQAYAQRQDRGKTSTTADPEAQTVPAADGGGYAELVMAQQLTTEVELAIILHLTQPLDADTATCCELPQVCEEPRQEAGADHGCLPYPTVTQESPMPLHDPPIVPSRFSTGMVGPEIAASGLPVSHARELKAKKSRPEIIRCGLIARFQLVEHELHPLAGQVIHATVSYLDFQRQETSRPRLLPDDGPYDSVPERQVGELTTFVPGWSSSKVAAAVRCRTTQWVGPARAASGVAAAGLVQQRYCLLHRANGPPRPGAGTASHQRKIPMTFTLVAIPHIFPCPHNLLKLFSTHAHFPPVFLEPVFKFSPIHSPEVMS